MSLKSPEIANTEEIKSKATVDLQKNPKDLSMCRTKVLRMFFHAKSKPILVIGREGL
jgi:hypothetical protein